MELLAIWLLASLVIAAILLCVYLIDTIRQDHVAWANERRSFQVEREKMADLYHTERRDLYDRLQAGTLPQYKELQDDTPNEVVVDDGVVDLEEAREEIALG